jgi:hypothetical protein
MAVTRIKTQEVVGALKAAGQSASILSKRERRPGFKVTQFNPAVVAVEFNGWGNLENTDHMAESVNLQSILEAAGYKVQRPWPDKTILGITKA